MFTEFAQKIYDATHLAIAYRLRSNQLVFWERLAKFLGLGVAPAIILGAVFFENEDLLIVSMIVSGLLSLSIWVWSIGSMAYKLERQLEISKSIPIQLDRLVSELHSIGESVNWENVSEKEKSRLKTVFKEILDIRKQLEDEQVHVSEWMNVKAQQETMDRERATCISCKQKWIQDHEFTKKEIMKALKDIKSGKRICPRCCQTLAEKEN